jgi:DNA-binding CsgD family transcriptional regulator
VEVAVSGIGEPRKRRGTGVALSAREREILGRLAAGETGERIATALVVSPETVRTHIRNAMTKLGASSRTHAVALALGRGEIEDVGNSERADDAPTGEGERSVGTPPVSRFHPLRRAASLEWRDELAMVLARLVSIYDVQAGAAFLSDEDGLSLRRVAIESEAGELDVNLPPETIVLGEGELGRAALERRAQLVHSSRTWGAGDSNATVLAPMVAAGRLVGAICLTVRSSRFISRGELLLLHAFGNRVAEILLQSGDPHDKLERALARFQMSWVRADAYA